jgi:hypothetical protein
MTLDEAIKNYERAADYDCYNERQFRIAGEYRQIAEWLRELKERRAAVRPREDKGELSQGSPLLSVTGITLLSMEEYKEYRYNIKPIDRWWWLRSPGFMRNHAAGVYRDGSVDGFGTYVNYPFAAVRPALILKGSSTIRQSFNFGGKAWTVISRALALADEPFCTMAFRKEWEGSDANDYEKSDIKPYLDAWFEGARKEG